MRRSSTERGVAVAPPACHTNGEGCAVMAAQELGASGGQGVLNLLLGIDKSRQHGIWVRGHVWYEWSGRQCVCDQPASSACPIPTLFHCKPGSGIHHALLTSKHRMLLPSRHLCACTTRVQHNPQSTPPSFNIKRFHVFWPMVAQRDLSSSSTGTGTEPGTQ